MLRARPANAPAFTSLRGPALTAPGPTLSIIIPAYNEATRLGPTLERVFAWLDASGLDAEVLVVDDGSKDATVALVEAHPRHDGRKLRCIRNDRNRGKGYSVGHGVREARGARILFSDADLSTPIEEYARLAPCLDGGADIAIGSRALAGAEIRRHQPFYREFMGRTFNRIVQALVFPGIRDTQCGFKLFTADAARRCFELRHVDGFAFDVEILYIARRLGLSVVEVPIVWENDDASRVSPVRHSIQMFRDIMRIRSLHRDLGR
jgi:dolichyl-phosphate beta-glucosyltransferase